MNILFTGDPVNHDATDTHTQMHTKACRASILLCGCHVAYFFCMHVVAYNSFDLASQSTLHHHHLHSDSASRAAHFGIDAIDAEKGVAFCFTSRSPASDVGANARARLRLDGRL